MDDIILNKIVIIENCLKRVHEEYDGFENELEYNYTKQDSILLNLQRSCEAAIDLGTRVIRINSFGIPQSSREVFSILEKEKVISRDLCERLQKMVGFRNVAVHDYQKVNLDIVRSIIKNQLSDFQEFISVIKATLRG